MALVRATFIRVIRGSIPFPPIHSCFGSGSAGLGLNWNTGESSDQAKRLHFRVVRVFRGQDCPRYATTADVFDSPKETEDRTALFSSYFSFAKSVRMAFTFRSSALQHTTPVSLLSW